MELCSKKGSPAPLFRTQAQKWTWLGGNSMVLNLPNCMKTEGEQLPAN